MLALEVDGLITQPAHSLFGADLLADFGGADEPFLRRGLRVGLGMVQSSRLGHRAADPAGGPGSGGACGSLPIRPTLPARKVTPTSIGAPPQVHADSAAGDSAVLGVDGRGDDQPVALFAPLLQWFGAPVWGEALEVGGLNLCACLDDCGPATGAPVIGPRLPDAASVRSGGVDHQWE